MTNERKYGIDILRIISMLFVVVLHYLGVGGAFYNITDGNVNLIQFNYCLSSLIEAFAIVGVNCFILISGYFLVNSKYKTKKVLKIYNVVIFYSLTFFIVYWILNGFSINNFLQSMFPIITSSYWFITIYIVLYLLSPFINKMVNSMDKKEHLKLIGLLILLFSVWKTLVPFVAPLDTTKGYGIIWFVVLYLIGAFISKYDFQIFKKNWLHLLSYFVITIGICIFKILCVLLSSKWTIFAEAQGLMYHYDSLTVLFSSVFLFMYFKNIKVKCNSIKKCIDFVVPSVFSIYIIHENFLFRETLWNKILKSSSYINSNYFVLHFVLSVLMVFIGCIIIDSIRRGLFKLFGYFANKYFFKNKEAQK